MGPDGVVSAATETFVKEALARLWAAVDSWRSRRKDKKKGEVTVDDSAVEKHLRVIIPWSERVTPLAAPAGKITEHSTVGMDIDVPRRYGWRDGQRHDESTLLTSQQNLVILGDPGAGKTTTVKRLVRHLLSPEINRSDTADFPVVIRCAELGEHRLLEEALADVFGIDHRRHVIDTGTDEGKVGETSLSQFHVVALASIGPPFVIPNKRNLPIELQLSDTLDASGALVMIDGLDETPQFLRDETHRAITTLVRLAQNTRFRVTCRPGYFTSLDGFDTVQLCPLTTEQIAEIARKWCSDPEGFLAALKQLPFRDVATLPLFLLQLIAVFESSGFEGIQATSVYRVVIDTALKKWDEHKKLKPRVSQYAAFEADIKFKFLCHLAFHLMYTLHKTQFSTEDLTRVYRMICEPFGLPHQQELQVARELESHTGIFVQWGPDRYEFAHLSMQEYLCAEFLLAVPMAALRPPAARRRQVRPHRRPRLRRAAVHLPGDVPERSARRAHRAVPATGRGGEIDRVGVGVHRQRAHPDRRHDVEGARGRHPRAASLQVQDVRPRSALLT
jgi:NACHT domain